MSRIKRSFHFMPDTTALRILSGDGMLHDRDIREPLFMYLEQEFGRIRIIEEKQMGRSRADIVMIGDGGICGIEIKSDADTYARLARQTKDYDRYYDKNIAVVGTSHAMHIEEHVPDWWGIITVEETEAGADFYFLRRPGENPAENLTAMQIGMLWRRELNHVLELNGLPAYREKSRKFVAAKIMEKVPEEILKGQIREELMQRDYTTIARDIEEYREQKVREAVARRVAARAGRTAGAKRRRKIFR